MDDNGLKFEERKYVSNNGGNNLNDMEFSKGGGGGGPAGFFSIKTNVYSKQCYSDPNNPGKMICKETKNSSGFDPFKKENNYKNTRENVYTKEYTSDEYGSYPRVSKEEPSFFEKISGKIKGIFSDDSNENFDKFDNSEKRFKDIGWNQKDLNNQYNNQRNYSNSKDDFFEHQNRDRFHEHQFNDYFSRDPFMSQFDRMFKQMQQAFIKDIFFEEEFDGRHPFEEFFKDVHIHPRSSRDREWDENFNHPFDDRNYFNHDDYDKYDDSNKSYRRAYRTNYNNFNQGNTNNHENYYHYERDSKPIKYSDNKIYDV